MSQPFAKAPRIPLPEFIALMAMLTATIAFSIDAMLPAMPEIAAELTPGNANNAQLILTSFVMGMGIATFVVGPLSDSFGRRPVVFGGALLFCIGSAIAWAGSSLETVLIGRVIQGFGAAAPRVVSMATVRDLYAGRDMARIMSFVMMIFMLVPAAAPLLGAQIISFSGWRGIFIAFICFMALATAWYAARLGETLEPANRRPFRAGPLWRSAREVLANRTAQVSIGIQTLQLAALFGTISQIQMLFDTTFDRAESFPMWFALIALGSGLASLLNAQLVVRLGMRRLVRVALIGQILLALAALALQLAGLIEGTTGFALFMIWITGSFFLVGFTMGNINAIAMEPLGHLAGMAASVIAAISTVVGVGLAAPLGLAFNGTILPLALGMAASTAVAALLLRFLPASRR